MLIIVDFRNVSKANAYRLTNVCTILMEQVFIFARVYFDAGLVGDASCQFVMKLMLFRALYTLVDA